jgi:hypothetical protein
LQPILVTFLLLDGGFGFGTQGLHLFPIIVARSQKSSLECSHRLLVEAQPY